MEIKNAVARMWVELGKQAVDGSGLFLLMNREVGRPGEGFVVVDRVSARTLLVDVREIKTDGSTKSVSLPVVDLLHRGQHPLDPGYDGINGGPINSRELK